LEELEARPSHLLGHHPELHQQWRDTQVQVSKAIKVANT
jgi:pterin-4a-carbinolamine dehydratase